MLTSFAGVWDSEALPAAIALWSLLDIMTTLLVDLEASMSHVADLVVWRWKSGRARGN